MNRRHRCLLVSIWMLLASWGLAAPALLAEGSQVGLVVQEGPDKITTYCVEINAPEITGYEVLARAGLDVAVTVQGGMGAGICRIGDTGCPGNDCFCDFPPNYWSYWHLDDGQWIYSQVGAGAFRVRAGSVEGWLWGRGNPPQVISLADICAPATATPNPTATWTDTPPPSATATIPASETPASAPLSETNAAVDTVTPSATRPPASPTASLTATETKPSAPPTETPLREMKNVTTQGSSSTSYLLFGVLLTMLVGAAVVLRFRRR